MAKPTHLGAERSHADPSFLPSLKEGVSVGAVSPHHETNLFFFFSFTLKMILVFFFFFPPFLPETDYELLIK